MSKRDRHDLEILRHALDAYAVKATAVAKAKAAGVDLGVPAPFMAMFGGSGVAEVLCIAVRAEKMRDEIDQSIETGATRVDLSFQLEPEVVDR